MANKQNTSKKRGRPSKYATAEEKAFADVERRRQRRRQEAHERRERLHAQYYAARASTTPLTSLTKPYTDGEVKIILEDPGKSVKEEHDVWLSAHPFSSDEDGSSYGTEDDVEVQLSIEPVSAPDAPQLCGEQLRVIELVRSGANVFYTGGAGTGKSTVLRAIVKELQARHRRVHVVTPTGISALNVSGSTYFTYAGWNPGVMKKPIREIRTMAMSKERRNRILSTDVLIIDEISMLESNQFRRLDQACRAARQREVAFGGIQVIVTGDFYQLPPVKAFQTCYECGFELKTRAFCPDCEPKDRADIHQPPSSRPRKGCLGCGKDLRKRMDCSQCNDTFDMDDQWAFRGDTWPASNFHCVSLTQVHRQNDPVFIDILNTLRVGDKLDDRQLSLLSRQSNDEGESVELSPVRREVDQKNWEGFQAIHGAVRAYRSQDHVYIQPHHPHLASKADLDADGNKLGCQDHRFPSLLETKFGMPVILLANIDAGAGLVNGSQGRIVGFSPHPPLMKAREQRLAESGEFTRFEEHQIVSWVQGQAPGFPLPVVRFENGAQQVVYPVCQDTELGDPPPFSVIARTQIPLLPAWAITIHKSQGMTLERAVVNLEHIFEPQMAYVALSRVRSLKGLSVVCNMGLKTLQERGRLGGGSDAVKAFMEERFGPAGLDDASVA